MSSKLQKRLERAEDASGINEPLGGEDVDDGDYSWRYNQAYQAVAQTMDAAHFFPAHAALEKFYAEGGKNKVRESCLPLLAYRVDSICRVYAWGFPVPAPVAQFPPALAELWLRFEREVIPETPIHVRHYLYHCGEECADCGAGHPYIPDRRPHGMCGGKFGPEIVRYTESCIVCGGVVGLSYYSNPTLREQHRRADA